MRISAVVTAVAVVAFLGWLGYHELSGSSGGSKSATSASAGKTVVALSRSGLRKVARLEATPIFWAGPKRGVTYEFTRLASGDTYVRYLPTGVRVGAASPYATVGTYPFVGAFAATASAAAQPGAIKVKVGGHGGGVAFYSPAHPDSVYVAYPGIDAQIEVFNPSPFLARRAVRSGSLSEVVKKAPASNSTGATIATVATLRALVGSLRHPIYWAGGVAHHKLELTHATDGRVWVRYIPRGAPAGVEKPYLTVATYPMANAYAVTDGLAHGSGTVRVSVPNAVAFYSSADPTSVYVAFKGVDEQIEVYDPTPSKAVSLVSSGHVRAVP